MATIDRNDVAALIEEGYSTEFLQTAEENSAAIGAFPVIRMGNKTVNLPVLASEPEAKFVNEWSDSGGAEQADATKPTSKLTWGSKNITAEEIAVIITTHENLLQDSSVDILSEITKQGGNAIARRLDGAVLNGTQKPVTWASDDLKAAVAATSQSVTVGTDAEDLLDALYQIEGEMADAGFNDPVIIAKRSLRSKLKNQRDANGAFLGAADVLADFDPSFTKHLGADVTAYVVDRESVRVGIRSDVSVKILTEATVNGVSLAETDQIGVRFTGRYGYVLKDNAAVWAINPAAAPEG